MKELELEVLYDTDETTLLEEIGIPIDIESYKRKKQTFYKIDSIAPHFSNDNLAKIYVTGDHWITPMSYESLKKLIRFTFETSK